MADAIEQARQLIARSRRIVAFTGAGVSAESGIPTYRGSGGGLWQEYDPDKYADINFFKKDPSYFWSFFKDFRYSTLVNSKPNNAHKAIARLEALGKLNVVITQNIDGLHLVAGNTNVIELHGNTRIIGCTECDALYDFEQIHKQVLAQLPPLCGKCSGVLKPQVVFFGEALPDNAMEMAVQASATCDLMLVVGSSLNVYPASSLPLIAKRSGAKVLIVNVGPTELDVIADVIVDAKAGKVMPEMIE